jgi:hypothetical protein
MFIFEAEWSLKLGGEYLCEFSSVFWLERILLSKGNFFDILDISKMSSHGNIIKTQLKEFFCKREDENAWQSYCNAENMANYSELLENRQEYFLILFEKITICLYSPIGK